MYWERVMPVLAPARTRLRGALGDVGAVVGEAALDGAGVGWVFGPVDQASLFECAGELGDEDRFEARPVGQFPLARMGTRPGEAVEGCEQGVLGVSQAERGEDPVDGRAQLGGEPPEKVAGGGVLRWSRHGDSVHGNYSHGNYRSSCPSYPRGSLFQGVARPATVQDPARA